MPTYRERLVPGPLVYLATALVVPASILIVAPVSVPVGIGVAVVLYLAVVALLTFGSPVVAVEDGELRAGRARIRVADLGEASAHRGSSALAEQRTRLDARAWLVLRGWIKPVVRVAVADDADPVPYWLVSSRRPDELVAAIEAARPADRAR